MSMSAGLVRGVVWVAVVVVWGVVSGWAVPAAAAAPAPPETDPYAATLAEQGIEGDAEGISAYLHDQRPDRVARRKIASLIARLGADEFEARERATQELIALPVVPLDDLRAAAAGGDGETRLRAARVIAARSAGNAGSSVAVACFRTIARRNVTGLAAVVLEAMPLYGEEFVLAAGREALRATSGPRDVALLRRAARQAGPVEARVAAAGALAAVAKNAARRDLIALLEDGEPRVQLAAARALADGGDRACLGALVELLSAGDARVRQGSIATLRALTGRSSEYAAWIDPDAQADAIGGWREWLVEQGRTARLTYPVRMGDLELGRTLICLYAKNEVIEVDAGGRQTFSVSEPGGCPWACQGLSGGGRVVALYSSNCVVEYRPDGKERVRIPVPGGPMSVQRLETGNTLVACNNAQKVAEVDDAGRVVWEAATDGGPCDAVRLENGHTLVTLQNANAVVELDSAGKDVWRVDGLRTPRSASRLENGNTLVCDLGSGRVVEFDGSGNEVWSQGGFSSPFCAQRLSGGTTLVSDTSAVKEIDRTGRVVGENRQQSLGRVWRY